MSAIITRRALVGGLALGISGCDQLGSSPGIRSLLQKAESGNFLIQRSLQSRMNMAKEFAPEDMSPVFRANGTRLPAGEVYATSAANKFADWRLTVDGLVTKPLALSLAQIRSMPARTQITRHDCVEGWSAIGKWTGVPIKLLLDMAGLRSRAKYLVFHCADTYGRSLYYESIDLVDAFHAQTILAWGMNDGLLPVPNGAPLRLRVERQLGYKQAKYVERIEAVEDLAAVYGGKGGYWEDGAGYEWYAGL
jgi:DMSO/TMAO reductase YedYZ molybdopterin-dependent catalytic subunit